MVPTFSEQEKLEKLSSVILQHRELFQKNQLDIDEQRAVINDTGVDVPIKDLWCEVCKKEHESPCSFFEAQTTGKLVLKCEQFFWWILS